MQATAEVIELFSKNRSDDELWDGGYVRICRREFTQGDSVFGKNRLMVAVWIEMICTAAWTDTTVSRGETSIRLKRGQFLLNYREWSERWCLTPVQMQRACRAMERGGRLSTQTVPVNTRKERKITIATVLNYDRYQPLDPDSATIQQRFSKPQENCGSQGHSDSATNQQRFTYNKERNLKDSSSSYEDDSPRGQAGRERAPPRWSTKQTDEALEIWRQELGDVLPKVIKLTASRRAALRGRLSDLGSLEDWRLYCRKIRRTPFLVGDNNRQWSADFDWTVKLANMAKVLEGRYDRQMV